MGYAVELYFDPAATGRVQDLCRELAGEGPTTDVHSLGALPHISLSLLENVDTATLGHELESFARTFAPIPLHLSAVGSFPGPEGVVYLAPSVSAPLLDVHAVHHERLGALGLRSHEYYRPGRWVPHCTVALNVEPDRVPSLIDRCRRSDVFGPVTLETIGLIRFLPIEPLGSYPIGS